ncbi:LGFP repeat-containing protein [Streptoalloteichus hindustanus]|uniref:LGFP repeat-containing protein n=1 Tax=Streptoalloteichus hindustanus TaxID=2017 RepID=A0A1M5IIG3_STRHI|nr:hypothetical protein [Streptoalloteichus hindustanus]SHG28055.1 LGFP repeat-containing protein [Streptoalloteichus hindustanus]
MPTTDEITTPDGIGRFNHLNRADGASIYWHPETGAHAIHGGIREKWGSLGWERGVGYPTTDEIATADGVGRFNHFDRGPLGPASIYHTPKLGAHLIYGGIRNRFMALGAERVVGYPTTDEIATADGVGRFNHFDGGSLGPASIYYTPSTDARLVFGAIRSKWAEMGWEHSYLGYPVSEESEVNSLATQEFQGGWIEHERRTNRTEARRK